MLVLDASALHRSRLDHPPVDSGMESPKTRFSAMVPLDNRHFAAGSRARGKGEGSDSEEASCLLDDVL